MKQLYPSENTFFPHICNKISHSTVVPVPLCHHALYLLWPDAWRSSASWSPLHAYSSRCLGGTGPGSAAASGGGPRPRSRLLARCTPHTGWWESKRMLTHNWTKSRRAEGKQIRNEQNKHKNLKRTALYNCTRQWHAAYSSGSERWVSRWFTTRGRHFCNLIHHK